MDNQPTLWDNPSPKILGQNTALSRLKEENPEYLNAFESEIDRLIRSGKTFTVEDIVEVIGLPSQGQNKNNSVGALMASFARHGKIISKGYVVAKKKSRHGRPLKLWIGNNAQK